LAVPRAGRFSQDFSKTLQYFMAVFETLAAAVLLDDM